jgi:hypothetical protein
MKATEPMPLPINDPQPGRRLATHGRAIVVIAIACLSVSALAVLPLLAAGLGKQIIQNMIMSEVKSHLIGTLARQGCKGAKLIALFSEAERLNLTKTGAAGLAGGMMPPTGMARGGIPPGMPGGIPGAMPGGAGGGAALAPPSGMMGIGRGGGPGIVSGGQAGFNGPSGPDLAALMARMQQQAGGRGQQMTPEQLQQVSQMMGQMQQSMSHPLSRTETLEVFEQLKGMGMLPDDMYSEARDCIMLADESALQGIGSTGAMFKSVVLPQLVEMKSKLAALPPEQREQLADQLSQALREATPSDRKAFREGLGKGFFPPEVIEKIGKQGAE